MRVGLVISEVVETAGGGYTYERDLIVSLVEGVRQSRHVLTLIGQAPQRPSFVPADCNYLSTKSRSSFPGKVYARASRFCLKLRHALGNEAGQPLPNDSGGMLAKWLRANGIQFLIHPNPSVMAPDVPYMAVCWDLQHRLQPYFPEVSNGGEWESRERQLSSCLRRATYVVTGTNEGKSQLERFYALSEERVAVLGLPTPRDALNHPRDGIGSTLEKHRLREPYLLYPAQFWAHKNHLTLLKALVLLRERHGLRPLLALAGSDAGQNRSFIATKAREWELTDKVRFLGFVPRNDLLDLYAGARMLVFPSTFGPDNIPPLEAFALGCPVVYGRVAGAEEQLGEAALLVDLFDAGAWSTAIQSVWSDEALRSRLVMAGQSRAMRWTARELAAGVFALLDRFVGIRELWD